MPSPEAPDPAPLPPSRKFLVALLLILVALGLWIVRPLLGPVVLALLGGLLLHPLHRRLAPRVRWPSVSAAILLLAVALFLVAPLALLAWQLRDDVTHIVALLQDPEALRRLSADLADTLGIEEATLHDMARDIGQRAASLLGSLIVPALRFFIDLLIAIIVFFFVLFFAIRDGADWIQRLRTYLPLPAEDKDHLLLGARDSIRAITLGTFAVAAIQGLVAAVGWWLFGFPNPVFWGTIMVILGILPFGAPFLITIPASIIALANGDLFAGIALFVYTITVVGLCDDLLRPLLVGRAASVHPALVLIGMLGGIIVFGIAGFLLGPLVFALLGPVLDVWAQHRRDRAENGQGLAS